MYKLFIFILTVVTVGVIADNYFLDTQNVTEAASYFTIDDVLDEQLTDSDFAILCNVYWTTEYSEALDAIKVSEPYLGPNAVKHLYQKLNKECY